MVCKAIAKGLKKHIGNKEITIFPLSDGGDGFLDTVYYHINTTKKTTSIKLNEKKLNLHYLISDDYKTAFIESSETVGFKYIHSDISILERSSLLLGLLIKRLLDKGFYSFVIGLGGSATNDFGMGLISALGAKFFDKNDNILSPVPKNIPFVEYIDMANFDKRINLSDFTVLADVSNPLIGKNGAANIYASQKGATKDEIAFLENAAKKYMKLFYDTFGMVIENKRMLGAAGGLGFAFEYFFNAKLKSGSKYVIELTNLENIIKNFDLIITGEGHFDTQSNFGKITGEVIKLSQKFNKPFIVLTGGSSEITSNRYNIIDISSSAFDKEFSIKNTALLLEKYGRTIGLLLSIK